MSRKLSFAIALASVFIAGCATQAPDVNTGEIETGNRPVETTPPSNKWKTYQNATFGYTLNFPAGGEIAFESPKKDYVEILDTKSDPAPRKWGVSVLENPQNLTADQYIDKTFGTAYVPGTPVDNRNCLESKKERTLTSFSATEVKEKCSMGVGLHEIANHGKYLYDIELIMGDEGIFNQLLTTFQFVD